MIAHAASNPQAKLLIPLEEDAAAAAADSSKPLLLSSIAEQGWKKKEICFDDSTHYHKFYMLDTMIVIL